MKPKARKILGWILVTPLLLILVGVVVSLVYTIATVEWWLPVVALAVLLCFGFGTSLLKRD